MVVPNPGFGVTWDGRLISMHVEYDTYRMPLPHGTLSKRVEKIVWSFRQSCVHANMGA
jgi:hypothetical protein